MKIIETSYFKKQVQELNKKYKLVSNDINFFRDNIIKEPFSDLGSGIFKYRVQNSSIPTGKRSGFRIIVFKEKNNYIPILIYAKNQKSNTNKEEIKNALLCTLQEL